MMVNGGETTAALASHWSRHKELQPSATLDSVTRLSGEVGSVKSNLK